LLTTTATSWRQLGRGGSGGGGDRRRRSSFGAGACCSVRWGKKGPRARDPRAGDTCGDGRRNEFEEVVAGDEERRMAGNGAATGFPVTTPVERMWEAQGSAKGQFRDSGCALIERRGEGSLSRAANGHQWPWGAAALIAIKGRRLIKSNGQN
jgi:hypothetical protein